MAEEAETQCLRMAATSSAMCAMRARFEQGEISYDIHGLRAIVEGR